MVGLFKENTRIALDSIKGQALRTSLTVMIIAKIGERRVGKEC